MNKKEMLEAIYKEIPYNEYIEDLYPTNGEVIMIGDVIDFYEENDDIFQDDEVIDILIETARLWLHKRLPIENQSEECIKYIFNLIK